MTFRALKFSILAMGSLLSAALVPLQAETLPDPGSLDPRIRLTPYNPDEVYRLAGFVGYQTDLQFDAGESFVGLAAGDIEGLSFVAQGNHLFLKPRAPTIGTNLTILTSLHTYQFDYSSSLRRPDATEAVTYALRFTYPPSPASTPALDPEATESHRRNMDYWYCGHPSLQPVAASDDGIHTRIRFAPQAEQPAIFVRNEDGSESLLNFSMDRDEVIVHRIAPRLILRRGNLTGCIVNAGFPGDGIRPKSGTVSDSVERMTREVRP
jgi:type IV secretion system protein VirB9